MAVTGYPLNGSAIHEVPVMSTQPPSDSPVPQPRSGLPGAWDTFIGPGTTAAENMLIFAVSIGGTILLLAHSANRQLDWTALQVVLVALLALDLLGGVVANATTAAKRWYHRPGQTERDHLGFIAVHFIHPLLIALVFREADWGYFVVTYGYLMGAALLILRVPLYLQRPVALTIYLGGLALGLMVFTPAAGLEWFLPVFYLKLLVSHLVAETPFKPAGSDD